MTVSRNLAGDTCGVCSGTGRGTGPFGTPTTCHGCRGTGRSAWRSGESPFGTPFPGSDAARSEGCRCPVLDNGHGDPALARDRGGWIIVVGCPLHSPTEAA